MLPRTLSIGCISLTAVLTLFVMQALEGRWTWMVHAEDGLVRHLPQLSAEFLPIPLAFLLWVRLMEQEKKFDLSFSPLFCALSIEGFAAAAALAGYNDVQQIALAFGIIAGLFVLAPFGECIKRAIHQPRPAIIALIAGSAACNYYFLMRTIWAQMCNLTTQTVYAFLHVFRFNAVSFVDPRKGSSFFILSPSFRIEVNPGCNGLEGIFLFNFLLSVMFLLDWDIFKNRRILPIYLFGLVYMFFFNVLRITALFTLGYWAYKPDAWGWVRLMQGVPVDMFHSYVGWVFYLVAFGLFAGWLYRSASGRAASGK